MPDASRLAAPERDRFQIMVNGKSITGYSGEMIATVLLAAGISPFRRTSSGAPRAPMCNMGVCFDCAVTIDGTPLQRACLTPALPGMVVETQ